jgi:serine/threonine-protein kinase
MATPPVGIGDVIAGKFVVERVIGEGGMGVVVSAQHRELEQRVAIKFLLTEFAEQGMAAERFRREARAAAKMRGEHVCRVLDVGTLDTGVPYMVMEYLDGRDLSDELQRRGRLPPEEAVGYVLEACEALAEAHGAGIIHRDLKPANLFLETRADGSRRIKVLDFGVSKSLLGLSTGHGALTKTSSLVGSPLYMSPEQLDSAKDVDGRTDVWSLGVVLYELLTGLTPFHGDSIPQLVAAVLQETPVRLSAQAFGLSQGLADVVERSLAKSRDQRYVSVVELAQALAPFASPSQRMSAQRMSRWREPIAAMTKGSGSDSQRGQDPANTPSQSTRPSTPFAWDRKNSRPTQRALWAAAVVLLVVLGALGLWALRTRAPVASTPPIAQEHQPSTPVAQPPSAPLGDTTPAAAAAAVEAPSAPPATSAAVNAAPENHDARAPDENLAPLANKPEPAPAPAREVKHPAPHPSSQPSAAPRPVEPAPQRATGLSDFGGRR